MSTKTYLGYAVYAESFENGTIILTTENGIEASNVIILEPEQLDNLNKFVTKQKEELKCKSELKK